MRNLTKILMMTIALIITSLYYFPIQVRWFPSLNSKMALAALGVGLFVIDCVKRRKFFIEKDTLYIMLLAVAVSICGLISVVYNSTNDMSYSTYIVSFLVWLFGAYTSVFFIRKAHSGISVWLVVNYLMAVCVFQCISALMINMIPAVKNFVDSWLYGFGFTTLEDVHDIGRMYGIGATLDVAGARFCPVLISIAVLCIESKRTKRERYLWLYILCFVFITIIGNMMGRTTTVGTILGLLVLLFPWDSSRSTINKRFFKRSAVLLSIIATLFLISAILYNTNIVFHNNLRFAFEGFFSLVETGEWHVSSNDRLANMVVWPESLKTWIIGDGYFEGAANDPNFVGNAKMKSFYMWTDIGYLRFIFYFGVTGLLSFIAYFIKCTSSCIKRFDNCEKLFIAALLLNFIIWFKVATDIFLFFALFLCVYKNEHDEYEESMLELDDEIEQE